MEEPPVVLVVEDEELIQNILKDALDSGGFGVVLASVGEEAIKLLGAEKSKYRALVTDVNLGRDKLTGWEVARHAREIDPHLAVVYMTGDSATDWTSQGVPHSILLNKPFAPAQLLTAVAQLLNVGGSNTV